MAMKLTKIQVSALFNYVEARTRRYAYAKHAVLAISLSIASYFVMRELLDGSGASTVPHWIPVALVGTGFVIATLSAGIYTWVVAVARSGLRKAGFSAELISDFERYSVRELSKQFDLSTTNQGDEA